MLQMHHKPLVYLREIDFTDLSYYKSKKYGISRAIYQYVGFTDEGLTKRTAKWSNTNLNHKKTKFLRGLMKMYKFKNRSELNNFLLKHTIVLKEFDIKKEARKFESTMISINMQEDAKNKHIICLNERDAELSVKEINELAKSFKNKDPIVLLHLHAIHSTSHCCPYLLCFFIKLKTDVFESLTFCSVHFSSPCINYINANPPSSQSFCVKLMNKFRVLSLCMFYIFLFLSCRVHLLNIM